MLCLNCMQLDDAESSNIRQLIHFQGLDWPDHSVPKGHDGVLTIVNEMREHVTSLTNPVLVHCRCVAARSILLSDFY